MVCEDQIPPELPPAARGQGSGHGAGGALRGSRLLTAEKLKQALVARAFGEGFAEVRVTTPEAIRGRSRHLDDWLAEGCHGEMGWMAERADKRADPARLWGEVKSVVMLATSYAPETNPLDYLNDRTKAALSVYALRRDYHDVIKGRLKTVAGLLAARGEDCKVFVDTAPVMEKPLAAAAGLGWQGKHTVLVSRRHGNWLWLGAIYTTAELPPDAPEPDRCGSCRRCLDICPTDAFPAPYRLDARRCVAYLTNEHKGPIPAELRPGVGNRVFGCDDCLAVCPWNRFAKAASDMKLSLRADLARMPLAELASLDDTRFRDLFAGTPVKRIGRERFLRNVLIALGNSDEPGLAAAAEARMRDDAPLVRGSAVWALGRLDPARAAGLKGEAMAGERDDVVRAEWAGIREWTA